MDISIHQVIISAVSSFRDLLPHFENVVVFLDGHEAIVGFHHLVVRKVLLVYSSRKLSWIRVVLPEQLRLPSILRWHAKLQSLRLCLLLRLLCLIEPLLLPPYRLHAYMLRGNAIA